MKIVLLLLALAMTLGSAESLYFADIVSAVGPTRGAQLSATNHTLQVVVVSPSACTVNLDGSIDGLTYFDLSGPQTCTSSVMFHVDGKPVAYVRANLTAYSGDAAGAKVKITYKGSN